MLRVAQPENQLRLSKQCDLWAFVWTSSSVAADFVTGLALAGESRRGSAAQLLEIGAGSGLCSVAAALAGWHVTATDAVVDALTLMQLNAARAGPDAASRFTTAQLDWHRGLGSSSLASEAQRFDVVVGADVLFLASNARPILTLLRGVFSSADPRRCEPTPSTDASDGAAEPSGTAAGAAKGAASVSCPPFALLFDPGRPGREEIEALAADYGLSCARYDFASLPTAVATMRECSVLLLSPIGAEAPGAAEGKAAGCDCVRCALRRAADTALTHLRSRCIGSGATLDPAAAASAGSSVVKAAYGYTLPSVPPL